MQEQIDEMFKDLCRAQTGGIKDDLTFGTLQESHTKSFIRTIARHLVYSGWVKWGEWISVNDKLPEYSQLVLIYTKWGTVSICRYSGKHELFNAYDEWWRPLAKLFCIKPTHWMPLPEPPKKGGK